MAETTSRILPRVIFPVAMFFALLTSGCPKTQETASPTAEGKREAAEAAKPEAISPQAPTPPVEKPAPAVPAVREHPVLSGESLLNPAIPQDASMIQYRLARLGLYKGAIDGVWGKTSRAALRSFKEKHSLSNPENWDRETQVLLFREASPTPQPASGTGHTPIASGETLLQPSAPRDAKMIQARLAELGLYRGAIDGVWGRSSRAALRAFKEKNSLGDPEAWDRDTQILLFRETGK